MADLCRMAEVGQRRQCPPPLCVQSLARADKQDRRHQDRHDAHRSTTKPATGWAITAPPANPCKNTAIGPAGNSAMGGMIGGTGPFATKPRGGIAGGGPAGARTSTFSQINHGAASRGAYSAATRNGITRVLRKVPYAGTAMAAYGAYDALTCD